MYHLNSLNYMRNILLVVVFSFLCFACDNSSQPSSKESAMTYLSSLAKLQQEVGKEVKACMESLATKDSLTIYNSLDKTKKCIDRVLPQLQQVEAMAGEEKLKEQAILMVKGYQELSETVIPEMAVLTVNMGKNGGITPSQKEKYLQQAELLKRKLLSFQAEGVKVRKAFMERYEIGK